MKKHIKRISLLLALCMLLSLTAMADSFDQVVTYDASAMGYGEIELELVGDVDANGEINITAAYAMGFDLIGMMTPEIEAELQAQLTEIGIYDVNSARNSAFGITTDTAANEAAYDHLVEESASYDSFVFDGGSYGTEDGYLTVTIGGIEMDPSALTGEYQDVVFTVTEQIPAFVDDYESPYRTALYYDKDGLNSELSVTSAVASGEFDDQNASELYIESHNDIFSGLIVSGGKHVIDGLTMVAEGNGANDFAGLGAGVAVGGNAQLTLNDYEFIAHGILRHGIFVGGDDVTNPPELTVNDGIILAGNPVDADENAMYEKTSSMSMNASPWMLGIEPDSEVRTQLMASTGRAVYNNCVLTSSGWGIVSSDAVDNPSAWGEYSIQMYLNDCILDFTGTSGYISYAIGATHNTFTGCLLGNAIASGALDDVSAYVKETYDYDLSYEDGVEIDENGRAYNTTYALIVANETSGGTFDNCEYTGQYGVMFHKTNNVRYVPGATDNSSAELPEEGGGYTLLKDSVFHTKGAGLLVKACTPYIQVENTVFDSQNDVILQLAVCDDPGMGSTHYAETLDITAAVEADPDYNPYDYNTKNQTLFDYNVENMISDVTVDFSDCNGESALNGNIFNSVSVSTTGEGMTWWGQNLICTFDNCEINGLISSSTALHTNYSGFYDAEGNEVEADSVEDAIANGAVEGRIEAANATYLGGLVNYPSETVNNGVWAILTGGTVWNVPDTCYLTVLEVEEGSVINGIVTVDGTAVDVTAGGRWTGKIVLEPSEDNGSSAGGEASPTNFTKTVQYTDTTYGYGTISLEVSGTIDSNGSVSILSASYAGEDVTSYMTSEIEAELIHLLSN